MKDFTKADQIDIALDLTVGSAADQNPRVQADRRRCTEILELAQELSELQPQEAAKQDRLRKALRRTIQGASKAQVALAMAAAFYVGRPTAMALVDQVQTWEYLRLLRRRDQEAR